MVFFDGISVKNLLSTFIFKSVHVFIVLNNGNPSYFW